MKKIYRILISRFKNTKENNEIERRRGICFGCIYNSNNSDVSDWRITFFKSLSRFLSLITGKTKEDNLGECNACGCSIVYKSQELVEDCVKGFWDKK